MSKSIVPPFAGDEQSRNGEKIRGLVEPILGSDARLVRSILFNKSDKANWLVAWHQDLAIAVNKRVQICAAHAQLLSPAQQATAYSLG